MSTTPLANLSLDELLVTVNARDLHGDFVSPKSDVADGLRAEIERRTKIKRSNMAGDSEAEKCERWVSAKPGDFIIQTRLAVEGVIAHLLESAATSFEVAFHNTKQGPNEWGDKVWLGVRYRVS